jgi:FkbM family methyltransferase
MARQDWESAEKSAFLEVLALHDVLLDIGANVGFYSCMAASFGKHTVAFEPSPRNLRFLYKNLWENKLNDVEIFPLGLAGRCGLERMFGFDAVASFVPGWADAHSASELVPLTTLDTVAACRFSGKRLFIKMDVEGFELDVLAGAAEVLCLDPKPTWLVEILLRSDCTPGGTNRRFYETFEVFWKHGYRARTLDTGSTDLLRADIERWVAKGYVDTGTRNFLFSSGEGSVE